MALSVRRICCLRLNLITGPCNIIFVLVSRIICGVRTAQMSREFMVGYAVLCYVSYVRCISRGVSVSFLDELCTHLKFIFVHCSVEWAEHCTRAWVQTVETAKAGASFWCDMHNTYMRTANQHNGHGSESIEWPNKIECAVYVKSPWNNVVAFHSFTPSSALWSRLPSCGRGMPALSSTLASNNIKFHFNKQNDVLCIYGHLRTPKQLIFCAWRPTQHAFDSVHDVIASRPRAVRVTCIGN